MRCHTSAGSRLVKAAAESAARVGPGACRAPRSDRHTRAARGRAGAPPAWASAPGRHRGGGFLHLGRHRGLPSPASTQKLNSGVAAGSSMRSKLLPGAKPPSARSTSWRHRSRTARRPRLAGRRPVAPARALLRRPRKPSPWIVAANWPFPRSGSCCRSPACRSASQPLHRRQRGERRCLGPACGSQGRQRAAKLPLPASASVTRLPSSTTVPSNTSEPLHRQRPVPARRGSMSPRVTEPSPAPGVVTRAGFDRHASSSSFHQRARRDNAAGLTIGRRRCRPDAPGLASAAGHGLGNDAAADTYRLPPSPAAMLTASASARCRAGNDADADLDAAGVDHVAVRAHLCAGPRPNRRRGRARSPPSSPATLPSLAVVLAPPPARCRSPACCLGDRSQAEVDAAGAAGDGLALAWACASAPTSMRPSFDDRAGTAAAGDADGQRVVDLRLNFGPRVGEPVRVAARHQRRQASRSPGSCRG